MLTREARLLGDSASQGFRVHAECDMPMFAHTSRSPSHVWYVTRRAAELSFPGHQS